LLSKALTFRSAGFNSDLIGKIRLIIVAILELGKFRREHLLDRNI
jgi:hypothetical protein